MASEQHHAKAQALLQQIDNSRQQRTSNDTSRNSMLDAEDRVLRLSQQLYVQRMYTDVSAALDAAKVKLREYETALSYSSSTKRLDVARLVADCNLKATSEMLVDDDAVCSLRAVENAQDHINAMLRDYPDCDKNLKAYMAGALDVLRKAGKLVESAKIESDGWLPVVGPVLQALEQMVRCRPIEEPLSRVVDEISKLDKEDQRIRDEQTVMLEDGNVAQNETLTQDRIQLMEGIADLVTHKFRIITQIDEGTLRVLQKETARIRNVTTGNSEALLRSTASKRAVLRDDLKRITDQRRKASDDERLARGAFEEQKDASDAALVENARRQDQCWKQMMALEQELIGLATQRRDEVDRRTRMVEREERRRCDMLHFTNFADTHCELLKTSLTSCEAEEELGQMMQEVVLQACAAVDSKVTAMKKTLEDSTLHAYAEHSDRFREQYLHLGDITYRKERLIDELDRRISMLNVQQDIAMQTFNPKARVLSEQRAELELERARVQQYVAVLHEKADAYVEAFKPTEKALRAVSQSFVHPIIELRKLNKERSRKLDQYYATTVHDTGLQETAKLTGVDHRIPATAAEVEAMRQNVEDARATYQPRKKFINRDGTRPSVDLTKKSDFNPLGDEPTLRRSVNDTKAGTPQPSSSSHGGQPTWKPGMRPPTDKKNTLRGAFGLADDLEPAGGRALRGISENRDGDVEVPAPLLPSESMSTATTDID